VSKDGTTRHTHQPPTILDASITFADGSEEKIGMNTAKLIVAQKVEIERLKQTNPNYKKSWEYRSKWHKPEEK